MVSYEDQDASYHDAMWLLLEKTEATGNHAHLRGSPFFLANPVWLFSHATLSWQRDCLLDKEWSMCQSRCLHHFRHKGQNVQFPAVEIYYGRAARSQWDPLIPIGSRRWCRPKVRNEFMKAWIVKIPVQNIAKTSTQRFNRHSYLIVILSRGSLFFFLNLLLRIFEIYSIS